MSAVAVGDLRRFEPVPDVLVLAAVERAERHRGRGREPVTMGEVVAHLGFVFGARATRGLRAQVDAFLAAGVLVRSRHYGIDRVSLSPSGRRRLSRARRAGNVPDLPESPQHRKWREAHHAAGELLDGLRERLSGTLTQAGRLLEGGGDSDEWFALARRLEAQASHVGQATYCLGEWVEPDDAHADLDGDFLMGDPRRSRRGGQWRESNA